MKKITFLLFFTIFTALTSFSQNFGHLTIFSEDGDKFFLVLNGEKINDVAQTNIRVEGLPQKYYNAKIFFQDKTKTPISDNNLTLTDADNIFQDVTYKIRRDKKDPKKLKLRFFSMIEIEPDFAPPASVVVFHYGQPQPTSVTTTQTTTTSTQGGGISMGANVPGVNVNISIQDPEMNGSVTQSTTTTTTYNSSNEVVYEEERPRGCNQNRAMSPTNFNAALQSLQKQKFEDTKLQSAKQIIRDNCMNAGQIAQICMEFKFEENKLEFAKTAYAFCTEPRNYFKINDVFTFSGSVDELNAFISKR